MTSNNNWYILRDPKKAYLEKQVYTGTFMPFVKDPSLYCKALLESARAELPVPSLIHLLER